MDFEMWGKSENSFEDSFLKTSEFAFSPGRSLAFLNHRAMFASLDFEILGMTLLHDSVTKA